ncbi:MAG: peptide deformylase [Bacteroidales bacterium]|jgi:peptide deformylase|nr:peptide deformylase [Bacteroidales bacterium]
MILPIVVYGSKILQQKAVSIDKDYPDIEQLISDMKETMLNAKGVGLAAPQIGQLISLFIVDTTEMEEEGSSQSPVKQVFINAEILERTGEDAVYSEGCLSVPGINENVTRKSIVTVEFMDENFEKHKKTYSGNAARVIQHEFDHIAGKTFIDRLSPLKKTILKRKLTDISTGKKQTFYKTKIIR